MTVRVGYEGILSRVLPEKTCRARFHNRRGLAEEVIPAVVYVNLIQPLRKYQKGFCKLCKFNLPFGFLAQLWSECFGDMAGFSALANEIALDGSSAQTEFSIEKKK